MDFFALAQACAPMVDPKTLTAIVRTESSFQQLAIGINGGAKLARQPATKKEATATAKWLIARGYSIDMGLAQINSTNLPRMGLSVEDVFDPCKNLNAAGTILQAAYKKARKAGQDERTALHSALSAYNTGSFTRGLANGYVRKVVGNMTNSNIRPAPVSPPRQTLQQTISRHDAFTESVMVYPQQ